jgi:hypothetical protein
MPGPVFGYVMVKPMYNPGKVYDFGLELFVVYRIIVSIVSVLGGPRGRGAQTNRKNTTKVPLHRTLYKESHAKKLLITIICELVCTKDFIY